MLNNAKAVPTLPVVDINRAREFYEEKLGLKPIGINMSGPKFPDVMYQTGGDTRLYLYQRAPTKADHTVVSFEVKDIEKEVKELRAKGVMFEEYDMPGLKTKDGIATLNGIRGAWFKDTEGNILEIGEYSKIAFREAAHALKIRAEKM